MKALVLSGGKGTRLKPLTTTMAKQLVPVANKPILFYVLDQIRGSGIDDIGIIIAPETGHLIKEAVGDGSRWNAKITYILQNEPKGLAHAVKTAHGYLGDSPFLMFLGDNLVQKGITGFVEEFRKNSSTVDSMILLKEVKETHLFGIAELNEKGQVFHIEEKPKVAKSNLAVIGVYIFSPVIHEAIEQIKPSWRGELEITDAIQKIIDMGKKVNSSILDGWWLDTGKKDDLLEANRVVLDEFLTRDLRCEPDKDCNIVGRVEIRKGTVVEKSIIRGPVSIAENCKLANCFIGPYTSIGAGSIVEKSEIEHSVILDNCRIQNIERLLDSVIGRNTQVTAHLDNIKATRLFLGDDARVEL
jgi:glucose-1-phosphate thymidylyltransferase